MTHSPEICAQSDPPSFEHNDFDQYLLIVPQPWELVKNVQSALIGSRPRAFQQAIYQPCTPNSPKGGTKRDADFAVFASKIQLLLKEVCCRVSLCENFQRQSCSYIIFLSNCPWTDCGSLPHLPKMCTKSDPLLQKMPILTDFA